MTDQPSRPNRPSRRLRILGAVLIVLVLSGCGYFEGLGDEMGQGCDCSVLEATVASIDWTGDGREPDRVLVAEGFRDLDQFPLRVKPIYEMSSPDEVDDLHAHIVAVMGAAGFTPAESRGAPGRNQTADYHTAHWDMTVYSTPSFTAGDGIGETSIDLFVDTPDGKTPEYLAPLIDAFGTR